MGAGPLDGMAAALSALQAGPGATDASGLFPFSVGGGEPGEYARALYALQTYGRRAGMAKQNNK